MKKIIISGVFFVMFITFSFIYCIDPVKPSFFEMSLIFPEEKTCVVNGLLDIIVEVNPPKLVESVTLTYSNKSKEKTMPSEFESGMVTFSNIQFNKTGEFKVKALVKVKNSGIQSREDTITIGEIPAFKNDKKIIVSSKDPKVGENFTMAVEAKGYGILTYLWCKGDTVLDGMDSIYSFSSLIKDNEGIYKCYVKNLWGRDKTEDFELAITNVNEPPVITVEPQDVSITPGQDAIFRIVATGGDILYQWYKNDEPITDGQSSEYKVLKAKLEDDGSEFKCIVRNYAGEDTSVVVVLNVKKEEIFPKIITHPKDATVKKGEKGIFIVKAEGTNLTYQWYKNDTEISPATENIYETPPAEEKDDKTEFRCIVKNSEGEVKSEVAVLFVHWAPEIDKHPKDLEVEKNKKAIFSISMKNKGNPECTYKWSNGKSGEKISFKASENDDGKEFYCEVSNSVSKIISKKAKLSVHWLENVTISPKSQEVEVGKSAKFSVKVGKSNPAPTSYTWKKGNQSWTGENITIPTNSENDGGTVYCKVSNGKLTKTAQASLSVKGMYKLKITPDNNLIINVDPKKEKYKKNEQVKLTASSKNNEYEFSHWTGDVSGSANPLTIKMNNNKSIGATSKKVNTEKSLVAHYPFNGSAKDISDYKNHGEIYGVKETTDRFGNENSAYYFDGKDDYIKVENSPSLNVDHITLSAWVYIVDITNGSGVNDRIITMSWYNNNSPYMTYGIHRVYNTQGVGIIIASGDNGKLNNYVTDEKVLKMNDWTHVCATFDGKKIKLYINGEFFGQNNVGDNIKISKTSQDIYIGCNSNNPDNKKEFIKGKLDDIRIYNRALTEQEVLSLFKETGWQ